MKSKNIVKLCWSLSDRVYNDDYTSPKHDLKRVKSIKNDNDYCEVWVDENRLFIVFRGSDDFKDWLENFCFGGLNEHENFSNSFEPFAEELADLVKQNLNKELVITGHSRGGAIATFAAEYLSIIKPLSCITFGSPKCGGRSFRDNYNKLPIDHTNFRNGWDQVTYLPLYTMGFRHVGKVVRLKKNQFWRLGYFRIKAHLRKSYSKAVKKCIK